MPPESSSGRLSIASARPTRAAPPRHLPPLGLPTRHAATGRSSRSARPKATETARSPERSGCAPATASRPGRRTTRYRRRSRPRARRSDRAACSCRSPTGPSRDDELARRHVEVDVAQRLVRARAFRPPRSCRRRGRPRHPSMRTVARPQRPLSTSRSAANRAMRRCTWRSSEIEAEAQHADQSRW